jgi:hypothetical protein
MGWDIIAMTQIDFDPKEPHGHFLEFTRAFLNTANRMRLRTLEIYELPFSPGLPTFRLDCDDLPWDKAFDLFDAACRRVPAERLAALHCVLNPARFECKSNHTPEDRNPFEEGSLYTSLQFHPETYRLAPSFNMEWYLGDNKNYDPDLKRSCWAINLPRVLDDLKAFVQAGHLRELWMPNTHYGYDRRDCILCLVPASLVRDEDCFIEAVLAGDAEIEAFEYGYLVYSKRFANGTLRAFFDALSEPLQSAILSH